MPSSDSIFRTRVCILDLYTQLVLFIESMEVYCTVAIAVATTLHHVLLKVAYPQHRKFTVTLTFYLSNFSNPVLLLLLE